VIDLRSILIAGIGNLYRKDDGIGVIISRAIKDRINTKNDLKVDIVEISEPSLLIDVLHGYDKIIIIDAIRSNSIDTIGSVHILNYKDIDDKCMTSTHTIDLKELLILTGTIYSINMDLILLGIKGKDFSIGEGLSSELMDKISGIISTVIDKINESIGN
jgi:hydrogenase maturation protease